MVDKWQEIVFLIDSVHLYCLLLIYKFVKIGHSREVLKEILYAKDNGSIISKAINKRKRFKSPTKSCCVKLSASNNLLVCYLLFNKGRCD